MEIESRFKDVEIKFNTLRSMIESKKTVFLTESDNIGSNGEFIFEVNSRVSSSATINVSFRLIGGAPQEFAFKIGGVYKSPYKSIIGENAYEFSCLLSGGKTRIELEFDDGTLVRDVKIKLSGYIDKTDYDSRLSSVSFDDFYVIGSKNGAKKTFTLVRHDEGVEYELFSENCEIASFAKFALTDLICVYGDGRNMHARIMRPNGEELLSVSFSANITALSGGYSDSGGVFYAIENGRVVKYHFDSEGNLAIIFTGYTGKEVFASTEFNDRFIVIGFDGKAKYVVS